MENQIVLLDKFIVCSDNIVAAFLGMHVSPVKHSYMRDYQEGVSTGQTHRHTDRQTDRRQTNWSLCATVTMLRRRHKNLLNFRNFRNFRKSSSRHMLNLNVNRENWCIITVAWTIVYHGRHSWTPGNRSPHPIIQNLGSCVRSVGASMASEAIQAGAAYSFGVRSRGQWFPPWY